MDIAIIPARGGSKRIPRKNIKEFYGKPMIAWAIERAKASGLFQHVIVSTDDEEIAAVARAWGAETPFIRPAVLSDDHSPTAPVIAHAIKALEVQGFHSQNACCIYPCVPFLAVADLILAKKISSTSDENFVYPVSEYAHPIQRAMRISQTGKMEFLSAEYELTRTQDLETTYHDAGQFYWGKVSAWVSGAKLHSTGVGLPIPKWRVVDIDDEQDWLRAELLFDTFNKIDLDRDV